MGLKITTLVTLTTTCTIKDQRKY